MTATAQPKGSPKAVWLFGVAIVATILIYIAWTSMTLVSRELASARAAHAQALGAREVLTDLQTVLILLRDAETGERGYIITSEPVFLETFESALQSLHEHFVAIESTHAGVTEPETLARLVALSKEHLVYLNQMIELQRRGDRKRAVEIIESQVGSGEWMKFAGWSRLCSRRSDDSWPCARRRLPTTPFNPRALSNWRCLLPCCSC